MRIVKCDPFENKIIVRCLKCFEYVPLKHAYADLDGKPFIDYYCPTCAGSLIHQEVENKLKEDFNGFIHTVSNER